MKKYLYKSGDECTAMTGSWKPYKISYIGSDTEHIPTISKETSSMTLAQIYDNNFGSVFAEKQVDLTAYKSLTIHFLSLIVVEKIDFDGYMADATFGVVSERVNNFYGLGKIKAQKVIFHAANLVKNDFFITVDISEVIGMQYIGIWFGSVGSNITMVVDKIWLEK